MSCTDSALNFVTQYAKKCVRCGQCRSVCPIFTEMKIEGFSPRAQVFLAELVHRGCREGTEQSVKDTPKAAAREGGDSDLTDKEGNFPDKNGGLIDKAWDRMLRCLLCRACYADCPSGVPVDDILIAARKEYIDCMGKPEPLRELSRRLFETYNIAGDINENRLLWMEDLGSMIDVPCVGVSKASSNGFVYFVGCVSSLYPGAYKIPQALAQIMHHAGIRFTVLGGEEWCCGYPLALLGLQDEAEKMAQHNVERVKSLGASQIVTSCPSCYYMWKHLSKEVGTGLEIIHYTELLYRIVAESGLELQPIEVVATYHDPCDLGRKCGIYDPPREVLARIPGLTLKEMAYSRQNARCCGGGGNLEMNDPWLSRRVAQSRLVQAVDTGATLIITACQQCVRTLTGAIRGARAYKAGISSPTNAKVPATQGFNMATQVSERDGHEDGKFAGIRVKDIAEVVWEAVRG